MRPLRRDISASLVLDTGPASLVQEGLWIETQLGRSGAAYNEAIALRISGSLDIDRLNLALAQVVARHPAMRTQFRPGPNGLEQQVTTVSPCALSPEPVAPDQTDDWLRQLQVQPFDPAQAPLFRTAMASVRPGQYVVALVAHHLIVDGWSLGVFQRDLSHFYASEDTAVLPEIAGTSINYAREQRRWLQSSASEADGRFWADQLLGVHIDLKGRGGPPETVPIRIAPSEVSMLYERARTLSASPFSLVLAAFAAAMQNATGRQDLMLATDFSDRTYPDYENMIAMMVNQLPLRWTFARALEAEERVRQAQLTVLTSIAHGKYPYPMIVRGSGRKDSTVFEAKFVLHNMPRAPMRLDDVSVETIVVPAVHAKFPVLLELWEEEGALAGTATVDPARSKLAATEIAAGVLEEVSQIVGQAMVRCHVKGAM